MHKPIDEKVIPMHSKEDPVPCPCACSKAEDTSKKTPDPKNAFALDQIKSQIDIGQINIGG